MTRDLHPVMSQQACFVCPEDPMSVALAPPVTPGSPVASFPRMSPVRPETQLLIHLMIHQGVGPLRYRMAVVQGPPLDLRIQHAYQFLLRGRAQRADRLSKVVKMLLDLGLAGLDEGLEAS